MWHHRRQCRWTKMIALVALGSLVTSCAPFTTEPAQPEPDPASVHQTAPLVPGTATPQGHATPPTTMPPTPSELVNGAAGTVVGTTRYPVPSDAVVVAMDGSDAAHGAPGAPVRSLTRAIQIATSGSTVVLRGGTYHESVTIPRNKRLTIQSWPGEEVWLDGSVEVTGWQRDGSHWRHDGWAYEFDSSPTFTRGAGDNTAPNWRFVSPDHPMAAHPDQVWIDGVAQRQVGSRAEVVQGSFFHDQANDHLYLGSDPTGGEVRASALQRAIRINRSHGSVIRGIGVRRYAPSVPDFGGVLVDHANDVVLEHLAITDGATTGLAVVGGNVTVRNVHLARHGMIGMRGTYSDGLVIDRVLSEGNNTERFNTAPVAGGAKISRSRHVTVRDSVFRENIGTGLWFDESAYDLVITGNEMRSNVRHGASLEISAKAVFVNNFVTGNGGWGIKINNTDQARIWNNTFAGNNGSVWLVQDSRRPATAPGRDPRQPFPDPTMTWVITSATFVNNVLANQRGGRPCMLCAQDGERLRTAEQMGVVTNHNVYNRPDLRTPSRLVTWSRGPAAPEHYAALSPFRFDTGQETAGHQVDGAPVVTTTGRPTAAMPPSSTALPIPADISSLTGIPSGSRHHGAR